ncbi:MAG: hypothetical protein VYC81_06630, partial [Actinomycetota bacterium]|nr:hypothetical protein [Actinomycetota bacterium]
PSITRSRFVEVLRRTAPRGALAAALARSLSLAACSREEEVAEPEPEPTIPEEVLWAGSVCTAFDELMATVDAVGEDLSYEPTADDEVFDQYITQLQAQMADVNGAVEELAFTVGQAPIDYKESAANVVSVGTDITAIIAAKDETVVHIEAAMAADSNIDKGLEAAQAAITGGTTLALTRELLAGLGDLLSQRKDDLDDAFGQASECQ